MGVFVMCLPSCLCFFFFLRGSGMGSRLLDVRGEPPPPPPDLSSFSSSVWLSSLLNVGMVSMCFLVDV